MSTWQTNLETMNYFFKAHFLIHFFFYIAQPNIVEFMLSD